MNPTIKLQREIAAEKAEMSIQKFIQIGQRNGQSFQEVNESVQEIFSLRQTEAEEKMNAYWKP